MPGSKKQQPVAKKAAPAKKTASKPKEDMANKIMMAPGRAFAKGMGYVINKSEAAGKALRAKIHEGTKPKPTGKPKPKGK